MAGCAETDQAWLLVGNGLRIWVVADRAARVASRHFAWRVRNIVRRAVGIACEVPICRGVAAAAVQRRRHVRVVQRVIQL